MSGANNFIQQAITIVTQAIEADNLHEYEKAYNLYKKSLDHFMLAVKYEQNKNSRDMVVQRMTGYMKRAEQLKEMIDAEAQPNKKPAAAAASTGGGGGGGDKGKDDDSKTDDPEKDKMRKALEGAVVSEKPNVKWDDVAGLHGAKDALKEAVILPARFPQLFTGKRKPWKGILLYGPPGTGKSFLAKAVATEADSNFFSVSSSDLVSKWQGESERLVKNLFEMARERKPSIVFIDEVDSLCSSRSEGESDSSRRIKTEFLVQMQGVGHEDTGLLVLGATNVPWELDPAMRRRFEKRVYIPLPEEEARTYMFHLNMKNIENDLDDASFKHLGKKTAGSSGSDIATLCREAMMEPLRKCQNAQFFQECDDNCHPLERGPKLTPKVHESGDAKIPPCAYCPTRLHADGTAAVPLPNEQFRCKYCFSWRLTLYQMDDDNKLKPPLVQVGDFNHVLSKHGATTVAEEELEEFIKWTKDFGEEG
jgi:vacuolar protein-sorting-associated protein 4